MKQKAFFEFFCGGGMARLGLSNNWKCLFANDFSPMKCSAYRANFEEHSELYEGDIRALASNDLESGAFLSWASFPCQDLSQAGKGGGLEAERSGTYWHFLSLMNGLGENRPKLIVLENVVGMLTSKQGDDFRTLLESLKESGYLFGALLLDAVYFLPQSRPRVFVVAIDKRLGIPYDRTLLGPVGFGHSNRIISAFNKLDSSLKENWIWWKMPVPPKRKSNLIDLIEREPVGVQWDEPEKTSKLLTMMSSRNLEKVEEARKVGELVVGAIYKRTRLNEHGEKVQRAEVRFDGNSGALRTPAGGSSRQILLFVEGKEIRSRLLSPREAARIMGVPDQYEIPDRYNQAYHLFGDGVVVPAVKWLDRHLLTPIFEEAFSKVLQSA